MTENDCKTEIKEAASGYVASYIHSQSKRTVANYVFRKKGLMIRIYTDNVSSYMEIFEKWTAAMKDTIKKLAHVKGCLIQWIAILVASYGIRFILDDERQQKCRNSGLNDETKPYLKEMMECEIQARE